MEARLFELYWTFILIQADPGGGSIVSFLPLLAIIAVFYFLLFRPNQKRQKKLQEMLANLKNGDPVITAGGLHGTIVALRGEYLVLRVPPESTRLEVLRSSITGMETAPEKSK
jgi:preprotein translocase subunit YajC